MPTPMEINADAIIVIIIELHSIQLPSWGFWCQKQASQGGISNCIPQYSVGCNYLFLPDIPANYLSLPEIPTPDTKVLNSHLQDSPWAAPILLHHNNIQRYILYNPGRILKRSRPDKSLLGKGRTQLARCPTGNSNLRDRDPRVDWDPREYSSTQRYMVDILIPTK